jgi:hypothetical protein
MLPVVPDFEPALGGDQVMTVGRNQWLCHVVSSPWRNRSSNPENLFSGLLFLTAIASAFR